MGETELKKALRRGGEEQAREFWQAAEAAVAARRHEIETHLANLHSESERRLQEECAVQRNNRVVAAQVRTREIRLRAESSLAERLLMLAKGMITELASDDRAALWTALCNELPAADWAVCRVHPRDRALAEARFPELEIMEDSTLGGGMIVENEENTVRVDNTLLCRLMRAWPDLLPALLQVLRKEAHNA